MRIAFTDAKLWLTNGVANEIDQQMIDSAHQVARVSLLAELLVMRRFE